MSVMSGGGILDIIQRRNPETEFDILKQIGSGTYGEVYKVSAVQSTLRWTHNQFVCELWLYTASA